MEKPSPPILVLIDKTAPNPFHSYIIEILDAEGIFCREIRDLSTRPLDQPCLADRDLVILANIPLSESGQKLLVDYVSSGGNLIASRPPPSMSPLFGLKPEGLNGIFPEGYVAFDPLRPILKNFPVSGLQFHGEGELCRIQDGQALGFFTADLRIKTNYPAVCCHEYGKGMAAAFLFDLATSTVLFHQGLASNSSLGFNPDPDRDKADKPNDLFQKFLDPALKEIPQADLYQDVLARIIQWMMRNKKPLPRIWYFPHAVPAVALIDGDSDAMKPADLESLIQIVEQAGGKYTLYVLHEDFAALPPEKMREFKNRGHDFGLHYYAGQMPGQDAMQAALQKQQGEFAKRYGDSSNATRGHCVIWVGWAEQARYFERVGISLDSSFIPVAGFQSGYLNASGLPMKFMDEKGKIIAVYEQSTLSGDDTFFTEKCFFPAKCKEEAIDVSIRQIDDTVERFHGVYHAYFHPVYFGTMKSYDPEWLEAVCRHIKKRGIPFVNSREWLTFNKARRSMEIENLNWDPEEGRLSFQLQCPASDGLTILLPSVFADRKAILPLPEKEISAKIVHPEQEDMLALVVHSKSEIKRMIVIDYRKAEV